MYVMITVVRTHRSMTFLLTAAPQITITPEGPCETPNILSITTGDSIRLVCTASGVPTPSVTWTTPDGDTTVGDGGCVTGLDMLCYWVLRCQGKAQQLCL